MKLDAAGEEFLGAYDKELRKAAGAYCTPIDIVRFQVRAIEELLRTELKVDGYADRDVSILDPATGTGAYLLGLFDHVRETTLARLGAEATRDVLRDLATRVHAFELLIGPCAVARGRLATMLRDQGVEASPRVVLTDTLAEKRDEAERIKTTRPIRVILGNPPYERTRLRADDGDDETGGRWDWIWKKVDDFKRGVPDEERVNLKNLADRYVLFYRWAFWKLLEEDPSGPGRGIVSFISNRSFLTGGAFAGMRAFMREHFQRIVIVDLGGDLNAPRMAGSGPDEPVFDIMTGTAIAICVRRGSERGASHVEYARLQGTATEKFAALRDLHIGERFRRVPGSNGDSFVPLGASAFASWPSLESIFAEASPGIETTRDHLAVSVRADSLREGIRRFNAATPEQALKLFHVTRDRPLPERPVRFDTASIASISFRPLDRRFVYLDDRFVGWPRPKLRKMWGPGNRAIITLPGKHGSGPAAWVHSELPDRHAYRGSYGGHVFPLWDHRTARGRVRPHNFGPDFLDALVAAYGDVNPESVFDYIYAVLQAPLYTRRFHEELQQGFPRVPFPKDKRLFDNEAERGEQLVSLHCFERSARRGENPSRLEGEDSAITHVAYDDGQQRVTLGAGVQLTEVTPAMWSYEVSGYAVLRRWLEAREKLTLTPEEIRELMAVVFAIRKTVEMGPMLDEAFERILARPQLDLSALDAGAEPTGNS